MGNRKKRGRTIGPALEDVSLHLEVAVFGAEMDVGGEHHLNVGLLLRQSPRHLRTAADRFQSNDDERIPPRWCRPSGRFNLNLI